VKPTDLEHSSIASFAKALLKELAVEVVLVGMDDSRGIRKDRASRFTHRSS
jgi:hypothetical protein